MKVGSLVECIEDFNPLEYEDEIFPITGQIYTVREIVEIGGYTGLRLEEIFNSPKQYREGVSECAFWIKRFREIQPPMSIEIDNLIEETLGV